jgi:hypothetical protein
VQHLRHDQRLFLTEPNTGETTKGVAPGYAFLSHAGAKRLFRRSHHMPYLQSDTIEAVVYDERDHLLKTKFRADGKVMVYEEVPQEVYDSLIFADSISYFFQEKIEGSYRVREVFSDTRGKSR